MLLIHVMLPISEYLQVTIMALLETFVEALEDVDKPMKAVIDIQSCTT